MGNTLRRLTSKCVTFAVAGRGAAKLCPLQFGVGVRGGCEGIVHGTRAFLKDEKITINRRWLLQVDLHNAFNLVDRIFMMAAVREHFPDISHWVESCYSVAPFLNLGKETISSTTGAHQGDPLGSLLFALSLHPVIAGVYKVELFMAKWCGIN